ncbi:hypothetical protein BV898_05790 [Hypsibius exemplaris]|uniref:Essential MCU regulator, mitochondrial n=1 Tax=Hypsibius exemplaris TaxID=2072580 RepID=A0A1W0WYK2_HYPEX|nr:hypothetical protein BV898_05790 [Hypsibius exemplaris]
MGLTTSKTLPPAAATGGRCFILSISGSPARVLSKLLQRGRPPRPDLFPPYPDDFTRFRRLTEKQPYRTRFGAGTAMMVCGGGIFIGSWLSRQLAEFLEVNEIFVPDDGGED